MRHFRGVLTLIQTLQGCPNPCTKSGQGQPTQHLIYKHSSDSTDHQTNPQLKGMVSHIKRNHHLPYQGPYN